MSSSEQTPRADGLELFHLGDFQLDSGAVLPDAFLAYKQFGDSKKPAIIYPTFYTGCEPTSISRGPSSTAILV